MVVVSEPVSLINGNGDCDDEDEEEDDEGFLYLEVLRKKYASQSPFITPSPQG